MPPVQLEVDLRSGVRALTSVMSVLHARSADVTGMSYDRQCDQASLLISVNGVRADAQLLARQLQRRVDVVRVRIRKPADVGDDAGAILRGPTT